MMPDREKVISNLQAVYEYLRHFENTAKMGEWVADAIALLKKQEAVEPKQGEWIYCEDASGQDGYKCSECGFFEPWYYDFENHNFITDYAYCPSCGKQMQEGR